MCLSKVRADPGFYWSYKTICSYGKMFQSKTAFLTVMKYLAEEVFERYSYSIFLFLLFYTKIFLATKFNRIWNLFFIYNMTMKINFKIISLYVLFVTFYFNIQNISLEDFCHEGLTGSMVAQKSPVWILFWRIRITDRIQYIIRNLNGKAYNSEQ